MNGEDRAFVIAFIAVAVLTALSLNAMFLPFDSDSAPSDALNDVEPILVEDKGD